jgi:hypothetical protein
MFRNKGFVIRAGLQPGRKKQRKDARALALATFSLHFDFLSGLLTLAPTSTADCLLQKSPSQSFSLAPFLEDKRFILHFFIHSPSPSCLFIRL